MALNPLVFVSHPRAVAKTPGGLQRCTDEFIRAFQAAGFDVRLSPIEHDRRLITRAWNRFFKPPYPPQWMPRAVREIARTAIDCGAPLVCLNLVNLAPMASKLKPLLPRDCRIVLLSHGLESVDYLHAIPPAWTPQHEMALGKRLLAERAHRESIDHVLCLTPFEAEIERWLGARRVTAVPRTIAPVRPIAWNPSGRRLGFVGTLDHAPTRDGLRAFLHAMQRADADEIEVRIVGQPEHEGRALASAFPIVRYLGGLDEDALIAEAATWSAFVHPLFCWARGCSTKLAVALGWQLPIVTTPAGARGYTWSHGDLEMAEDPEAFAALARRLTDRGRAEAARRGVADIVRTAPTIEHVGRMLRDLFDAKTVDRERVWA